MNLMQEKKEVAKIRKVKKDLQISMQSKPKVVKVQNTKSIDLNSKKIMQINKSTVSAPSKPSAPAPANEIPEKTLAQKKC